ncbi:MAG: hypothetical protein GY917_09470 [Planctomycetaceae bacterium]|nr:hypothetical protein [Planctomycetaceae bacterium]
MIHGESPAQSGSTIFRQWQFNGARRVVRLPITSELQIGCLSKASGRGTFTVKNIGNRIDHF